MTKRRCTKRSQRAATELMLAVSHGNVAFTYDTLGEEFEQVEPDLESDDDYVVLPSPHEIWPDHLGDDNDLQISLFLMPPDYITTAVRQIEYQTGMASSKLYVIASCEHVREPVAESMGFLTDDLRREMEEQPGAWLVQVFMITKPRETSTR